LLAVVEPAEHQRSIGVAVLEPDRHLPAHAGNDHGGAETELHHPEPGARLVVADARAIPVEAHLHPAVFVGVNRLLLVARPRDDARLDAANAWAGRAPRRREGSAGRNGGEAVLGREVLGLAI